MAQQGIIIRAVAGFYYVYSDGIIYECKARGVFKKKGVTPLVGDDVGMTRIAGPGEQPSASSPDMGVGSVDEILPRLNSFDRPPVANVELMIIVAAARHPEPSLLMLDKVAAAAELNGAEILVCVNKKDLAKPGQLEELLEHYRGVYPVVVISAREEGDQAELQELKKALNGKKAALAGPSGAGKSTLANLLLGEQRSATGEISRRLQRGKNTTRHSELFAGDGFFLFDTPGFTSFDLLGVKPDEIVPLFPDIAAHSSGCRFSDCRHLSEPDCAVRSALDRGEISGTRYESYKAIYAAAAEAEKRQY